MKRVLIFLGAFALGLLPPGYAAESNPDNGLLVEAWGRIVARESNADKFGFDETQRAVLVKGLEAGIAQQPPPQPLDQIYTDVIHFVEVRTAEFRKMQKAENLAAADVYFDALKQKPGVIVLPGGVCCEVLRAGDGESPRADQAVTVTYHARLLDGAEFDSTEQLGAVEIVLSKIIRGWADGIQTMRVGGKARLHVPPALGFSDSDAAMMGIPPGATTVAEIELLAIKDAPMEEQPPPPAPVPPLHEPAGFSERQIIETWGWLLAQERGVARVELSADERFRFIAGLTGALEKRAADFDEAKLYDSVARFVAGRQEAREKMIREKRAAENAVFFEKLKADPEIVSLPSGLCYEVVRPGEGRPPRSDQRVLVNYTGRLIDGTLFDRTDPELGPLEVDVGRVIAGWTEGIQKIGTGGRITLYIPPTLGYGDVSTGGIPVGAVLIFDIELLKVSDVPVE
ncbi:FKBP-type peptidyl-prolyl cis-trans isomerase [Nibricoccus aquaticus]|nr:FKBP-type peptidyl-prolyl cis-trans isomerase [Nibricoccus aquaticus]